MMLCGRLSLCVLLAAVLLGGASALSDTLTIEAQKDNTLYEDATGSLSNGAGPVVFAGRNVQGVGSIRRGLIAFDVAGSVPAGSTITAVALTLHLSRSQAGAETITLHRVLQDWGEGTSRAGGEGGGGAPATTNDATWLHSSFDTVLWTNAGGDFSEIVSASVSVVGEGSYTWGSTTQMVADVQGWLDAPGGSFGWLLRGNETAGRTTKRFDSRESSVEANRPQLTLVFVRPADCNRNDVPDSQDIAGGRSRDCNHNAVPDECDISDGGSQDVDRNRVPDECQADCNGNDVGDMEDIFSGADTDCNGNRVPDACDIAGGTGSDLNQNGLPDECDPDCNANGVPDDLDIAEETSGDCNANDVPDECEIAAGSSRDCDGDGIPDTCQPDRDGDGTVDGCDNCPDHPNPALADTDGDGVGDVCQRLRPSPLCCGCLQWPVLVLCTLGHAVLPGPGARRRRRSIDPS